ncbi:MAG: MFS transporter [Cytophagales bacterium]
MKNNPKIINAWCMYDWAVSVYNLTITSAVFPIYYSKVAVNAQGGDLINFFGFEVKNSVLYSYSLSFTFLLIALVSPVLTSISDYTGRKKIFMRIFCFIGSTACMLLYFFETETANFAIIMFVLAGIGYSGSFVFYNSYLPEIATEDQYDRISAKGYSMGYIGSVLLLIFNLVMIMKPEYFGGISTGLATRLSFLSVGIWWLGFALYSFYYLPKDQIVHSIKEKGWIFKGFHNLRAVFRDITTYPNIKQFLIAFFFYNVGVQTVMLIATVFAEKELHLPTAALIGTVLILQIIAIAGAYLFARLSARFGNIMSLSVMVGIWILICFGAYMVRDGYDFYLLAAVVGLVMGGIQSLSRATFAKLIPQNSHENASYFSFYEAVSAVSIVVGTLAYGLIEAFTGSARNSIIVLGAFFVVGLLFLLKVHVPKPNDDTDIDRLQKIKIDP